MKLGAHAHVRGHAFRVDLGRAPGTRRASSAATASSSAALPPHAIRGSRRVTRHAHSHAIVRVPTWRVGRARGLTHPRANHSRVSRRTSRCGVPWGADGAQSRRGALRLGAGGERADVPLDGVPWGADGAQSRRGALPLGAGGERADVPLDGVPRGADGAWSGGVPRGAGDLVVVLDPLGLVHDVPIRKRPANSTQLNSTQAATFRLNPRTATPCGSRTPTRSAARKPRPSRTGVGWSRPLSAFRLDLGRASLACGRANGGRVVLPAARGKATPWRAARAARAARAVLAVRAARAARAARRSAAAVEAKRTHARTPGRASR